MYVCSVIIYFFSQLQGVVYVYGCTERMGENKGLTGEIVNFVCVCGLKNLFLF